MGHNALPERPWVALLRGKVLTCWKGSRGAHPIPAVTEPTQVNSLSRLCVQTQTSTWLPDPGQSP